MDLESSGKQEEGLTAYANESGKFDGEKGEIQPKTCNDIIFALLFLGHLCGMAYFLSVGVGSVNFDYSGLAWTVAICGLFASALTTVSLSIMMTCAAQVIKMALFFSLCVSLAVAIQGFISGQILVGILGIIFLVLSAIYTYIVMAHVPFAASNMKTAIFAAKANKGLLLLTFVFLLVAFGWAVWWSVAAGGALSQWKPGIIFLFLLSFYWTHNVIKNTLHVTAAGVVGTWWHRPDEASSCCSSALKDSFLRATTYSFGSICMGSLLVSIFQALRELNQMAKKSDSCSIVACCLDCILRCVERVIAYFNKWAFVYVGLYGYKYLDAGQNVTTLFEKKGWSAIITDDLVEKVMLMFSIAVGLLTGLFGLYLASANKDIFGGIGFDEDYKSVGFFVGLLTGFLLSSVVFGVISSAVDTVVVLFAEAPMEFESNYPELSNEMRATWRQSYPVECASL